MVRCIVVKVETDEILAKVIEKYVDPENEYIRIDTTISKSNPNSNYRNIPIGTYFSLIHGVINGVNKK